MSKLAKALTAAAGNAAGESLYVEDVFSTYLFTAKSGTTDNGDMVNGINLADEGGMVWIKDRTEGYPHNLIDTERGNTKRLQSQSSAAQSDTGTYGLLAFNQDGFELGTGGGAMWGRDTGNNQVASWTFRKAEKFFDIVTYTGDGNTSQTINHNLGANVGMIVVKRLDAVGHFTVWHKDISSNSNVLFLSSSLGEISSPNDFQSTAPTSTQFTVGGGLNYSGESFVAYLFASDAGGFGDDGSESIIKCGSFTTDGSGNATVDLGFEPQFFIHKASNSTSSWYMYDVSRSWTAGTGSKYLLYANASSAENQLSSNDNIQLTSTGFNVGLDANETHIYIAIRRPMKTPESGTEVFDPNYTTSNQFVTTGFPVDLQIGQYTGGGSAYWVDRLRGMSTSTTGSMQYLRSTSGNAEASNTGSLGFNGFVQNGFSHTLGNFAQRLFSFKRATGFFDVVAYKGNSVTGRTVTHNLGAAPELLMIKARDVAFGWVIGSNQLNGGVNPWSYEFYTWNSSLSSTTRFNNTAPTDTEFTLSNNGLVNSSSYNYVAYLFSSLDGVSKVGTYTGTGASLNVDCGFSAGARFVMVSQANYGLWYIFDSARGITVSNNPSISPSTTTAEVTSAARDINPYSGGFNLPAGASQLNTSGTDYIFLAIA